MSSTDSIGEMIPKETPPRTLSDLLTRSLGQQFDCEILLMNLLCAENLPGAEIIERETCISAVDRMVDCVRELTKLEIFKKTPERWDFCVEKFRIHVMICVLQRVFGLQYDPRKTDGQSDPELQDAFVHGTIKTKRGTCASLPVLYAAVGRKLGYPLKLVAARGKHFGHFFVRWDGLGDQRFNIEVNNNGWNDPPDQHYRMGQYSSRPRWEESRSLLASMTAHEELAQFMSQRAACWGQMGNKRFEVEALAWANALAPHDVFHREFLYRAMNSWHDRVQAMWRCGLPELYIRHPPRRFPESLPEQIEREITGLTVLEHIANCERAAAIEPNSADKRRFNFPTRLNIELIPDGRDVHIRCF